MMRYISIEVIVLLALIGFVVAMCQLAKRFIWRGEPLHPSFVGSLLSASGTIFAASIAWSISDHNIQFQREAAAGQTALRMKNERQAKKQMIDVTAEADRQLGLILENFPLDLPEDAYADTPRHHHSRSSSRYG